MICPYCYADIPPWLVGCWNCGNILSRRILELVRERDEVKGEMAEDS